MTKAPQTAQTDTLSIQPSAAPEVRVMVPFEDNRLLAELLGQFDSHLAILEERLGIEAVAHGNVVTLRGTAPACATAEAVLQGLYQRLARGERVSHGDVEGAIRHARSAGGPGANGG